MEALPQDILLSTVAPHQRGIRIHMPEYDFVAHLPTTLALLTSRKVRVTRGHLAACFERVVCDQGLQLHRLPPSLEQLSQVVDSSLVRVFAIPGFFAPVLRASSCNLSVVSEVPGVVSSPPCYPLPALLGHHHWRFWGDVALVDDQYPKSLRKARLSYSCTNLHTVWET